jgi:regulator of cell morphogenesis and NO signaling
MSTHEPLSTASCSINRPSSSTVGQLVAERPERARVFEAFGIDYCCAGRVSLDEACIKRGLDPDQVRARLRDSDATPAAKVEPDWMVTPLSWLADHIESTHHRLMRAELPRAAALVKKVAAVHGERNPKLAELRQTFEEFSRDLMAHMDKEDAVLFPLIRSLESESVSGRTSPLERPVRVMMHEHDDAGEALRRMRELTNGFTPPGDACSTYRVMLSALQAIEADLHTHVHKENNILFPRALGMETSRQTS